MPLHLTTYFKDAYSASRAEFEDLALLWWGCAVPHGVRRDQQKCSEIYLSKQ